MSIALLRTVLIMAGANALSWAPAQADRNIQSDCTSIDDPAARLACYDEKNLVPGERVVTSAPPQRPLLQAGSTSVPAMPIAVAPQQSARSPQPAQTTSIVTAVAEQRRGIYLLTLEDGAQWEFAEDVAPTYRAPERSSRVEIGRGALGTYRMRFDGQQPVRVRRVR